MIQIRPQMTQIEQIYTDKMLKIRVNLFNSLYLWSNFGYYISYPTICFFENHLTNFVLKFKQHNMKFYITLTLIVIVSQTMSAQEYITEGKNRLNFAKTYLELGGQFSPSFIG
ncbi:MAG: hypothetical protein RLZZ306_2815, partial [Bacteroidota bacterium]